MVGHYDGGRHREALDFVGSGSKLGVGGNDNM